VAQAKSETDMIEQPTRDAAFLRSRGRRRFVPKVVLMGCAAVALYSSTVAAQQSRSTAADDKIVARQCEVDLRARCAVTPGALDDSVRSCIKQQFNSLADECRSWLARLAAINKACVPDIKQNCPDVRAGHFRIVECLQSAISKLSDACKDGLARTMSGKR
jgi:hypothetical protein